MLLLGPHFFNTKIYEITFGSKFFKIFTTFQLKFSFKKWRPGGRQWLTARPELVGTPGLDNYSTLKYYFLPNLFFLSRYSSHTTNAN